MPQDIIMTNGNNKLRFIDSARASTMPEDAGFCSGDDYIDHGVHSPTDSSEDSVEVKVSTITLNHKKRKLTEDSRKSSSFTGPLKKRMCLRKEIKTEPNDSAKAPFRPWNPASAATSVPSFAVPVPIIKLENSGTRPAFSYFRPPSPVVATVHQNEQPVSLVIKREKVDVTDVRVPDHPQVAKLSTVETERMILKTNEHFPGLQTSPSSSQSFSNEPSSSKRSESKREQRNYKNMTRERRIEANARERTRVHTISAAFDTLRRAIPSYSHNQKLSKLSVLRIAYSYIMTLGALVNHDESNTESSISECVDLVTRTIQREGKLRKKKDDSD